MLKVVRPLSFFMEEVVILLFVNVPRVCCIFTEFAQLYLFLDTNLYRYYYIGIDFILRFLRKYYIYVHFTSDLHLC